MRKPEVLFTILSILILSILINLGFCIRCLLFRSYIGKLSTRKWNCQFLYLLC
ncbi:unnamed protein product [Schistosoma curassoni]|uniref:DUF4395 domain-containing protein n=1 Tax=Schistosoma curassoni TaxID=6186 RepID=A0A183JBL9_9TREM|nr:unnamed protein product [Schistosoma curassoni]